MGNLMDIFRGGHEFSAAAERFLAQDSEAMFELTNTLSKNFGAEVLHQAGLPDMQASIPDYLIPGMPISERPQHEISDVIAAPGIAAVNETVETPDALRHTTEGEQHEYANVIGFPQQGSHLAVNAVVDPLQPGIVQTDLKLAS